MIWQARTQSQQYVANQSNLLGLAGSAREPNEMSAINTFVKTLTVK
jgi:hypothetical protein